MKTSRPTGSNAAIWGRWSARQKRGGYLCTVHPSRNQLRPEPTVGAIEREVTDRLFAFFPVRHEPEPILEHAPEHCQQLRREAVGIRPRQTTWCQRNHVEASFR